VGGKTIIYHNNIFYYGVSAFRD